LTETDLRLSDGQGLDIDFERLQSVPEADYERMSELKTGVLYVAAAKTGGLLAGADEGRTAALEVYARRFALAFQERDDLLGAGVVRSDIGGSKQGDIEKGKRTRLFAVATARMPAATRRAFLAAYGKGTRTTAKDVRLVRNLLREYALEPTTDRIEENVTRAIASLRDARPSEPYATVLETLARAQLSRTA
ncbi:MAG: polyprenyl synthetase family protein, partial [Euryarchaeota archaeon]|nr:polyprenyl synthetase family protein [Euryarchaeota archaeon]